MEFAPMLAGMEEMRVAQRKNSQAVKPKLRARLKAQAVRSLAALSKAWNATDIEDRFFFPGLALVGYGVYRLSPDYALITVGAVLILAVRPLRRWL